MLFSIAYVCQLGIAVALRLTSLYLKSYVRTPIHTHTEWAEGWFNLLNFFFSFIIFKLVSKQIDRVLCYHCPVKVLSPPWWNYCLPPPLFSADKHQVFLISASDSRPRVHPCQQPPSFSSANTRSGMIHQETVNPHEGWNIAMHSFLVCFNEASDSTRFPLLTSATLCGLYSVRKPSLSSF